jgi:DNA-binding ferritin-like protein (Dps family)|tara:strand:- start:2774 stop:2971 length:198 start_codon:yes stop_codon:yes gene_type:complete
MGDSDRIFNEILALEKERNKALKEMEGILGFDISFSDEMVMRNARDTFAKAYDKELKEKLKKWMK